MRFNLFSEESDWYELASKLKGISHRPEKAQGADAIFLKNFYPTSSLIPSASSRGLTCSQSQSKTASFVGESR